MGIMDEKLRVTMPDGSKWEVPVLVIAMDRAKYYAGKDFDGDIDQSLKEDTIPLFESDSYQVEDWASNNMNWSEVEKDAVKVVISDVDYQKGWVNGDTEIVD